MFHIFNSLEHEPCNCDSYIEREPIETMKLNILDAKVVGWGERHNHLEMLQNTFSIGSCLHMIITIAMQSASQLKI